MTDEAPRRRNPRGQGDRLREEIVEAAALLLDEAGTSEAVTLRAVARQAGIAAPSIYRHFPDPQAILLAVAREAFAELHQRLGDAFRTGPGDPVGVLGAVCQAYLSYAGERPSRYRVMFGGVWIVDPDRRGSISEDDVMSLGAEALEVLTAALTACVDVGASDSTDPRSDAVALWLGLHGLAHQRAVLPRFPWPADIQGRMIRRLAGLESAT